MLVKGIPALLAIALLAGCASVPTQDERLTQQAKQFNEPSEGNAGLYIYRDGVLGGSLKKSLYLDDQCLGETAPKTFFYTELPAGKTYKVSTESEFSNNDMTLETIAGQKYYLQQYMKMGVFVGGANLREVDEAKAQKAIQGLKLAVAGTCD